MNLEYRAVSTLSSLAPWLAPLPSAFLIYRGSIEYLQFPSEIAILTASGVEALGIAAINTALMLANYNRDKGKSQPAANPGAALWAAGIYLAVVVIVNILLDIGTRPALQICAQAFLSILPISGALILATRSEHARRTEMNERQRIEAKAERMLTKQERKPAVIAPLPRRYKCDKCEFETDNQRAFAGHSRKHKKVTNVT